MFKHSGDRGFIYGLTRGENSLAGVFKHSSESGFIYLPTRGGKSLSPGGGGTLQQEGGGEYLSLECINTLARVVNFLLIKKKW